MNHNTVLTYLERILLLLFCSFTFGTLFGQSNMPDDSYTIIMEAATLCATEPRKAMDMLRPLKQTFKVKGSYENPDDFNVYNTLISVENTIHSLNKHFSFIYKNLQEIQSNIKPLQSRKDSYAFIYFFSRLYVLTYKCQEKGGGANREQALQRRNKNHNRPSKTI